MKLWYNSPATEWNEALRKTVIHAGHDRTVRIFPIEGKTTDRPVRKMDGLWAIDLKAGERLTIR